MRDVFLVKDHAGRFTPATDADADVVKAIRPGMGIHVRFTQLSRPSVKHHRKYWAGLIKLGMHYWKPTGGLITDEEASLVMELASFLESYAGNTGAITAAATEFLKQLQSKRAERITPPEPDEQQLHEFIKLQSGFYDYITTPTGIRKKPRSIAMKALSKQEFEEFYKVAFQVLWNFVLSRHFKSEQEADNAVGQLMHLDRG